MPKWVRELRERMHTGEGTLWGTDPGADTDAGNLGMGLGHPHWGPRLGPSGGPTCRKGPGRDSSQGYVLWVRTPPKGINVLAPITALV